MQCVCPPGYKEEHCDKCSGGGGERFYSSKKIRKHFTETKGRVDKEVKEFYRGERVGKSGTTAPLVDSMVEVEVEDTLGEAVAKTILIPVGVRVDGSMLKTINRVLFVTIRLVVIR